MSTPVPGRSRPTRPTRGARTAAFVTLAALACARESELDEVFLPPHPIELTDVRRPPVARYDFAPGSDVEFRVGPRSGRLRGRVRVVGGGLVVDSFELGSTRGHASLDLTTVALEDDAPAGLSAPPFWASREPGSPTERALAWLELVPPRSTAAPQRPDLRFARFTLTSVGGLAAPAALDGQRLPSSAGAGARRRVRLEASGELELHGVRFPYTAPLDLIFEWADPVAPGQNPRRIEITTREPVLVDLTTHAIVPRRASGELDAEALSELRKGLGHQLWVTAHWSAALSSTSTKAVLGP